MFKNTSKWFGKIADELECRAGHPLTFAAFVLWCIVAPIVSVDVANYVISVITAALVFLTISASRRDRLAVHVKLDDLEHAIDKANDDLAGIEEATEEEIRAKRKANNNEQE